MSAIASEPETGSTRDAPPMRARMARFTMLQFVRVPPTAGLAPEIVSHLATGTVGQAWYRVDDGDWTSLSGPIEDLQYSELRFAMDRDRWRSLVPAANVDADIAPACVTVVIAPHQLRSGPRVEQLVSIGVAAWTDWPLGESAAPGLPPGAAPPPAQWATIDLDDLVAAYGEELLAALLYAVAPGIVPTTLPIYDTSALPPTAFLAVPDGPWPASGDDWCHREPWLASTNELLASLLYVRDVSDERLAGSIQPRTGTLTLYRHVEVGSYARSHLLFLPSGGGDIAAFEDEATNLAQFLDYLDDLATYQLWDATTDLQAAMDRTADYVAIVERAADAVNPLLLALASADDTNVDQVRSAIHLVRTTLVQSEPELSQLKSMIDQHRANLTALQATTRRYRRTLGERAPHDMSHVDEARVHTTPFEQVEDAVALATRELEKVGPIRGLIDSTAGILAERREESLARLTTAAHSLNWVLLILAAATTIDLLVHFNWDETYPWVSPILRSVLIAGLVGVAIWAFARAVTRRSTEPNHSVGDVDLANLRTAIVAWAHRARTETVRSLSPEDQTRFDAERAAELARIWDLLDDAEAALWKNQASMATADQPTMITHLVNQAEFWAAQSLLIGERPFPMPRQLPLVTSLFHFRRGGMYVSSFEFSQAVVLGPRTETFRSWGVALGPTVARATELLGRVQQQYAAEVAALGVPGQ